jgi:hypothetical protein
VRPSRSCTSSSPWREASWRESPTRSSDSRGPSTSESCGSHLRAASPRQRRCEWRFVHVLRGQRGGPVRLETPLRRAPSTGASSPKRSRSRSSTAAARAPARASSSLGDAARGDAVRPRVHLGHRPARVRAPGVVVRSGRRAAGRSPGHARRRRPLLRTAGALSRRSCVRALRKHSRLGVLAAARQSGWFGDRDGRTPLPFTDGLRPGDAGAGYFREARTDPRPSPVVDRTRR